MGNRLKMSTLLGVVRSLRDELMNIEMSFCGLKSRSLILFLPHFDVFLNVVLSYLNLSLKIDSFHRRRLVSKHIQERGGKKLS